MKIVGRILATPFLACATLVFVLVLWIKYMRNFILYGGEFIAYVNKEQPKTILDIYEKIEPWKT